MRPFFLLRPGHGHEKLSCNGWAEPDRVSIQPWYCCLSLRVVGVGEVSVARLRQFASLERGARNSAEASHGILYTTNPKLLGFVPSGSFVTKHE